MTLSVKHKFISAKADGTDNTLVKPTNWNAEHDLVTDTDGVILGRPAGAGPGPIVEVPIGGLIPAGVVLDFAGPAANVPAGWLLCHGQSLARADYPGLFAAIGTTHGAGAVPGTTFAAPDYRGLALAGKTDMGGADRGNLAGGGVLGATIGAQLQGSLGVNVGAWFGGGGYAASGYTTGQQSVRVYGNTDTVGGGLGTVGGGPAVGSHAHWFDVTHYSNGENLSVTINSFGASGGTASNFYLIQPTGITNKIIKT